MAGGHEKGKSLVAAPLWADRYHLQPEVFHLLPHTIAKTQTLHQQGFATLMPVCAAP
jgi:hypothetical protein